MGEKYVHSRMTFKIFERTDKYTQESIPLIFILSPGGKKVSTGYSCKKGSWDQRSQAIQTTGVHKDPKAPQLNAKLKRASIALQDIIDKTNNINLIRDGYKKYLNELTGVPIEIKQLENIPIYGGNTILKKFNGATVTGKEFCLEIFQLLHSHRSDWAKGYKDRFLALCFKILEYEPDFHLSMVSDEWWRGFINFCIDKKKNISNTISSNAETIIAMIKELGYDKKMIEGIHWKYIEPEILALDWSKILIIESTNLDNYSSPTIKDSKILWLAGAFTGRRWEEISESDPSNFYEKDGKWRYKNIGKGMRMIDIPLLPEAVQFFKKINFAVPRISNGVVNRDIRIICKEAGFESKILKITPIDSNTVKRELKEEWQTVHFHTSRHSYAQHIVELAAGKPHAEKWVSFMLGHASHQTTWKYMNRSASSNDQFFDELFKDSNNKG